MIFKVTCLCCIFESTSAILFGEHFATDMAGVESFEDMVGTREVVAVATESGEAAATESGGAVATVWRGGGDRVQRGGDNRRRDGGDGWYRDGSERWNNADEGPYTIDVRHVEKMVGTTREKRRMATESGGDKTATRPGTRSAVPGTRPTTRRLRRLVTNETAATGGV